ncbi:protein translocase subunit SecF [archaeon]|nr:protein translocase subunit SecF [archaeon]
MAISVRNFYKEHYKLLIVIPLLILLGALLVFAASYAKTGEIIKKDISLTGGVSATIYTSEQYPELESSLRQKFPEAEFSVRQLSEFGTKTQRGILIESTSISAEELKSALQEIAGFELNQDNYSSEIVGASLGSAFFRQMLIAIVLAFAFIMVTVFIIFKMPLPCFTIIFCVFCDMVIALAVWNLLGFKLSTGTIAAVLLLIGYSIDTDILLTTRMLKRKEGTIIDRCFSSIKTGMTMTITTLAALIAGYFIISSIALKSMFLIMIFGLFADIIFTYLFNAAVLLWYRSRKEQFIGGSMSRTP